jgi:glycosyltransferase involved in cell wall biosynthesis
MTSKPKVSILCLTYNQEKYIRQTLDGFLMQKTNFGYEILINDDASNDGTISILKEYESKNPGVFKLVLHEENLYSKGERNFFGSFLLPKAKGKYIALCEGDDYWTDPNKLQLQVDFLDNHKDHSVCFHPVKVIFENHQEPDTIFPKPVKQSEFNVRKLLKENFIQTNSVIYRALPDYKYMPTDISPADSYLHLLHAKNGKIGFINRVMAVYRRHPGGIWWNYYVDQEGMWRKIGVAHSRYFTEVLKLYGDKPEDEKIIKSSLHHLFNIFVSIDIKYGDNLIGKSLKASPTLTNYYSEFALHELIEAKKDLLSIQKEISDLQERSYNLSSQLNSLKNSRVWKLRNKIAKLTKRPAV